MSQLLANTRKLLQSTYKTYYLRDIIIHGRHRKNLIETLCMYPNNGVNFRVWQREWPLTKYYIVTHVDAKDGRFGEIYGYLYIDGEKQSSQPVIVEEWYNKTWNHEVGEDSVVMDNGMEFSEEDFKTFKAIHFPLDKKLSF